MIVQAVALVEVHVYEKLEPLVTVRVPSELLALMSTVTGTASWTVTESLPVATPSVQSMLTVTGEPTVGYHEWLGSIGPAEPFVAAPEAPEGVLMVQAVESVDVQV